MYKVQKNRNGYTYNGRRYVEVYRGHILGSCLREVDMHGKVLYNGGQIEFRDAVIEDKC